MFPFTSCGGYHLSSEFLGKLRMNFLIDFALSDLMSWWFSGDGGYRSKWTFVEHTNWRSLCCRHMRFCQPLPTLISHVWLFLSLYSSRYSSFNFYIHAWNWVKHWFKENEVCTSDHDVSLGGCIKLHWQLLIKQRMVEWTKTCIPSV